MDVLNGIQESSNLSKAFFCESNLKHVNDLIRYQVWLSTNEKYIIGQQNEFELIMIMRSIYLQEALNQPHNIGKQVNDLNNSVVSQTVPRLIAEVKQFLTYNNEIVEERKILPRSINPSIKGHKSLEQHPW